MKKPLFYLAMLTIVVIFLSGCGSGLMESSAEVLGDKADPDLPIIKRDLIPKNDEITMFIALDKEIKDAQTDKKDDSTQTQTKEETKTAQKAQAFKTEKMSGNYMAKEPLNIRKGPGIDYESIGKLTPYAKAVVSEKSIHNGNTWYKVTANGVTGWSSAKLLVAYEENAKPAQQVAKQTGKKQPVAQAKPNSNPAPKKETPAQKPAAKPAPKPAAKPSGSSPTGIEKAVIDLTNAERRKAGLAPLKIDSRAVASAQAKSNDMAAKGYFSHTSPTYGSSDQQLKTFGASFTAWGENLGKGQRSAEQVVKEWMNSPSHKANILHPTMTHIGVGYNASGNYWTQQFIRK